MDSWNFSVPEKLNLFDSVDDLEYFGINVSSTDCETQSPVFKTPLRRSVSMETIAFPTRTERFNEKIKETSVQAPKIKLKTQPKTPNLLTKYRGRCRNVPTAEDRERIAYEEMQRYRFKAQNVNPNVLKGAIPKNTIPKKPNTIQEPFKITEVKRHTPKKEASPMVFKAKPLKKNFFEKVVGVKSVEAELPTVPKTPMVLKRSILREKQNEQTEPPQPKGNPKPPIHLLQHVEQMKERKMKRIQAALEEALAKCKQFHPKPAPKFTKRPFTTSSDSIKSQRENQSDNLENIKPFKASHPVVLNQKPFEPKKSGNTTKFQEFKLSYPERSLMWKKSQEERKIRADLLEKYIEEMKLEEAEREKEKLMALRKQTVHKPKPILKSTFELHHTTQITVPETPKVLKKRTPRKP